MKTTLPSLLLLTLAACAAPMTATEPDRAGLHEAPSAGYAIVIHGGAGSPSRSMSAEQRAGIVGGLQQALTIGRDALESGAPALEVVELVIRSLEDDPHFNSGRGAVYTAEEGHELDASIMDGATLACGAVGGVTTVRHPITLARLVMTETRHVLFVADGAEAFADTQPVERVDNTWFDTEDNRDYLHRVLEERRSAQALAPGATGAERAAAEASALARLAELDAPASTFGTVGCAVLDSSGHLAAGTSTGGLTAKSFGRIGDSPIIGAGTYANDATCAVSATGVGEEFIRHGIARDISARMDYLGLELEEATAQTMALLEPGVGGVVCLDHAGNITMSYNTTGMLRAAADASGRFEVRIWEDAEGLD